MTRSRSNKHRHPHHRTRQRGQILPLVIFGAVPLVLMLILLLNTGMRVTERIRVQNAADAAALSHASWNARAMNVMAMNNVAITQSLGITVITGALIPVIGEMYVQSGIKTAEYVRNGIACLSLTVGAPPCIAFWAQREYDLVTKVVVPITRDFPLTQITRDLARFERITRALGDMNKRIADGFPDFARRAAGDLAEQNGVGRNGIRFYAAHQDRVSSRADTTELPVKRGGLDGAGIGGGGVALSSLCAAGKTGTTSAGLVGQVGGRMQYRNFQEHGYRTGVGPYTHGRDDVWSRLKKPYNRLRYNHYAPLIFDFRTVADIAWEAACNAVGLASIYNVKTGGLSLGSVTGLGEPDRQLYSLLAFARKPLSGPALLAKSFPGSIGPVYGYAQAELYNPHNYDLYSQSWRARLAPARLMTETPNWKLTRTVQDFPKLEQVIREVGAGDLATVNAH